MEGRLTAAYPSSTVEAAKRPTEKAMDDEELSTLIAAASAGPAAMLATRLLFDALIARGIINKLEAVEVIDAAILLLEQRPKSTPLRTALMRGQRLHLAMLLRGLAPRERPGPAGRDGGA